MRSKSERTDDVWAALAAIIPVARATQGVISLDIACDLLDANSFVATGIYEDSAALERQESAPEVHTAMAMLFGGAGGAARSNDLRRVARSGTRLSYSVRTAGSPSTSFDKDARNRPDSYAGRRAVRNAGQRTIVSCVGCRPRSIRLMTPVVCARGRARARALAPKQSPTRESWQRDVGACVRRRSRARRTRCTCRPSSGRRRFVVPNVDDDELARSPFPGWCRIMT
jgi:quinol monooxygenase YgiN